MADLRDAATICGCPQTAELYDEGEVAHAPSCPFSDCDEATIDAMIADYEATHP